jgi:phosphoglycolate phosphatase
MPRLCLFDCDGTLVDSQHEIIATMRRAFAVSGLAEPTVDAIRHIVGLSLTDAVRALLPSGEGERMGHRVAEAYLTQLAEIRRSEGPGEPLFPGAVAALDAIEASGWVLGIATGKSRPALLTTLAEHGLAHRFATLQTADVVAAGKPAPDMVLRAMAETGAGRADTVMVGDTVYDVLMARRAGTAAIGVGWGYHPADALARAGAARVADTFADLIVVLATLAAGAARPGRA